MRLVISATVVAFLSLVTSPGHAQRTKAKAPTANKHYVKRTFTVSGGTAINYWLMSPEKVKEGAKYPLVLALHGRGGSTTAATQLGSDQLRKQFPCFVMAPAVESRAANWASPAGIKKKSRKAMLPVALTAMDALIKQSPIDPNRVYVTGQSMGGVGTFGA
ncbi:MAG: alpha/beta hydrolase-fold protein, partial [Pirellulaceae bacterium]|nr:alpha/beta hydrolase-fold protein [Pirellulaceae bacterium]